MTRACACAGVCKVNCQILLLGMISFETKTVHIKKIVKKIVKKICQKNLSKNVLKKLSKNYIHNKKQKETE